MSDTGYYGSYADFTCPDRKAAPAFMNSDNIVGDPFTIEMDYSGNKRQAWIVNPFGFRMGVLNEKTAKQGRPMQRKRLENGRASCLRCLQGRTQTW